MTRAFLSVRPLEALALWLWAGFLGSELAWGATVELAPAIHRGVGWLFMLIWAGAPVAVWILRRRRAAPTPHSPS